jgi:hypothetical protein
MLSLAAQKWTTMAEALPTAPENRGWKLLARDRAAISTRELEKKRSAAVGRLELADAAEKAKRSDEAARIRREVIQEFGQFSDLEPILRQAKEKLPKPALPKVAPPEIDATKPGENATPKNAAASPGRS